MHLTLSKKYWQELLAPGDIAIDATCGNGYDTLFLAKILAGRVIGIDIQEKAIENTRKLLQESLSQEMFERVVLHCGSHETLPQVRPRLIVYNLGYLPKGDKSITTQTESTLRSIQAGMEILAEGGALSITCYPGHDEGLREEAVLIQWAESLPKEEWTVCHHSWINRARAPSLIWITSK